LNKEALCADIVLLDGSKTRKEEGNMRSWKKCERGRKRNREE